MELLDSRRLTGPSLLWRLAGSVVDASCNRAEQEALITAWEQAVRAMLDALGWHEEQTTVHRFGYGVSLAISAPIDALYAATEVNEWAFNVAMDKVAGTSSAKSFEQALEALGQEIAQEVNPKLLGLKAAAQGNHVPFLSDDDEASLGYGTGSATWPVNDLPDLGSIAWQDLHSIPVGIITGTNGKTTTVRLAMGIGRAAGKNVGLSSTDWVGVNDRVIDRGDYSGPGGARAVLRDQEVDLAILETARGGLLRRGLGVEEAQGALITNIAEDHLGDFGSKSIDELLDVKWVVSRALDDQSVLVLNADDHRLVAKAGEASVPVAWFSIQADNPVLQECVSSNGRVATVRDGRFVIFDDGDWLDVCDVSDVPLTLNGIAKHNVSNALGAALLTYGLGIDINAIASGLKSTRLSDNPGRCNLFDVDGATVLVDFAHNPEGMQAIFHVATELPAKRRLLCFGQAGDRTDDSIRELAGVAWGLGLERVHISELAKYARGRAPKEVFGLLREGLMEKGASDSQIQHFEHEIDALKAAVDWANPGDLVIMLALAGGPEIVSWLEAEAKGR